MNINDLNNSKTPLVKIDKRLNKFQQKVLFSKKLVIAEKLLSRAKFPEELKKYQKI